MPAPKAHITVTGAATYDTFAVVNPPAGPRSPRGPRGPRGPRAMDLPWLLIRLGLIPTRLASVAARNAVAARNVSAFVGPDLAVATYVPAAAPPDNATNNAMSATTIAGE